MNKPDRKMFRVLMMGEPIEKIALMKKFIGHLLQSEREKVFKAFNEVLIFDQEWVKLLSRVEQILSVAEETTKEPEK